MNKQTLGYVFNWRILIAIEEWITYAFGIFLFCYKLYYWLYFVGLLQAYVILIEYYNHHRFETDVINGKREKFPGHFKLTVAQYNFLIKKKFLVLFDKVLWAILLIGINHNTFMFYNTEFELKVLFWIIFTFGAIFNYVGYAYVITLQKDWFLIHYKIPRE